MGIDDEIDNKSEQTTGMLKQSAGKATDNDETQAEGRTDQAGADVKQAGEKIKDGFTS